MWICRCHSRPLNRRGHRASASSRVLQTVSWARIVFRRQPGSSCEKVTSKGSYYSLIAITQVLQKAAPTPANVENAAHGFGTTASNLQELKEVGVSVFSGGNHTFDRKEIFDFIDNEPYLLRPANYPESTAGKGYCLIEIKDVQIAIINLLGRELMKPVRSPFMVADSIIAEIQEKTKLILVDMHAELTAEKVAMGWYLNGRVSAVVGTHTHVQTADNRILPGGTAYITDLGCCGPINGIIGMNQKAAFRRMIDQLPAHLEVADGPCAVCGVQITVDAISGQARSIERVQFFEND